MLHDVIQRQFKSLNRATGEKVSPDTLQLLSVFRFVFFNSPGNISRVIFHGMADEMI